MYMRTDQKVEAFKSFFRWAVIVLGCAWAVWFCWGLAGVFGGGA